jgi:hypothetical protein
MDTSELEVLRPADAQGITPGPGEPVSLPGQVSGPTLRLSSVLPEAYVADLEQLLFFNPGQYRVCPGIEAVVAKYGLPEIVAEEGTLRLRVGALGKVQTLFAFNDTEGASELAGVIVYFRQSVGEIVILGIAIANRFTARQSGRSTVALRLLRQVQRAARQMRGVCWVTADAGEGPVQRRV